MRGVYERRQPRLRRAVFLDRDGVINLALVRGGKPYAPTSLSDFVILPGVVEALARLYAAEFHLIVVTNQPDISRGVLQRDTLNQMHKILKLQLPIVEIRVCSHTEEDHCGCRKPNPSMLKMAAQDHYISLVDSFMVGDRWSDVEAGRRAGCKTVFIDYGYSEQRPWSEPDATVRSLSEAADWILK